MSSRLVKAFVVPSTNPSHGEQFPTQRDKNVNAEVSAKSMSHVKKKKAIFWF